MNWYAAHAVIFLQSPVDAEVFRIEESIYLVLAVNAKEAEKKAKRLARHAMQGWEGSWMEDDPQRRQVIYKFEGIKKVVCFSKGRAPLSSGQEITSNIYTLAGEDELERFMVSGEVSIVRAR